MIFQLDSCLDERVEGTYLQEAEPHASLGLGVLLERVVECQASLGLGVLLERGAECQASLGLGVLLERGVECQASQGLGGQVDPNNQSFA